MAVTFWRMTALATTSVYLIRFSCSSRSFSALTPSPPKESGEA